MMRMREFLQAESDTDKDDFLARFRHSFLLINKSPEGERGASFETAAPGEARRMLIRSQDEAELHELVAVRRANRVTVGRTTINDIVLEGDSISKFHAFFRLDGGGACAICDPGSTNGTVVNGQALERDDAHPLRGGETIVFGGAYEATFHTPESLFRHLTMLKRWAR